MGSGGREISIQSVPQSERYESEQLALLGWSISAFAHGIILAVAAVINFHAMVHTALPKNELFRWDVSLMAAPKTESVMAQGVQAQAAPEAVETDLLPNPDAQPMHKASEHSHRLYESTRSDIETAKSNPRPNAPHPRSAPDQSPISREQAVRTEALAVANPATSVLPPPQVESQQESSHLQVETQLENPTVLQRPQPVTRSLITQTALPDYGWLMEELRTKLERVKAYPISAKAAHAQGRVVVQVRIRADGHLLNPEVEESSGYPMLDQAALEALRAASPLQLEHGLRDGSIVMLVPLNYQLE
ncbi:MAG: energy transducer TonB [Nitrospira sp.]|nr:energy transducer TonB [Nitrospira sp.]